MKLTHWIWLGRFSSTRLFLNTQTSSSSQPRQVTRPSRGLPCSTVATEIPVDEFGLRIRLPNVLTLLSKVSGVLLGRGPWHLIEFEVNAGRGCPLPGRH